MESIKVFSPATVANIGCGFDILGLALENIGDVITLEKRNDKNIVIKDVTPFNLPVSPEQNIVSIAINALLRELNEFVGFNLTIEKKVKPGSGLGSSGSSAAAGVFAINELLGKPFDKLALTRFAMEGEKAISLKGHADNVGASIYGGLILVKGYNPLDIVEIDFPEDLVIALIYPQVEVKTSEAKKLLREYILLDDAITQWGNVAGLVTGMIKKDHDLIGRSLKDVVAEPVRSILIPDYYKIKSMAMEKGALGFNISGSGPSMFAFCKSTQIAESIIDESKTIYAKSGIDVETYISKINPKGTIAI